MQVQTYGRIFGIHLMGGAPPEIIKHDITENKTFLMYVGRSNNNSKVLHI